MKKSNSRMVAMAGRARQFSNWAGGDYQDRAKFAHTPGTIGAGMSGFAYASGNGAAPVSGAQVSPVDKEIALTIENTYDEVLFYPLFNAGDTYNVPYNSVLDPISGNTPGANEGLIATFDGISEAFMKRFILNNNYTVNNIIYGLGTVSNQLSQNWKVYQQDVNGDVTQSTYRPFPMQNTLQNISTTVQLSNFFKVINVGTTTFIPVLPGNTISLYIYLSAQINNDLLLQGRVPLETYQKVNNLGGFTV